MRKLTNLIADILESYNAYINKVPKGCHLVAELLREEKNKDALEQIALFSEGVSWIIEVKEKLESKGMYLPFDESEIITFLGEINEALVIQDYVLVADLFEYEIAPFFESCTTIEI